MCFCFYRSENVGSFCSLFFAALPLYSVTPTAAGESVTNRCLRVWSRALGTYGEELLERALL